MTTVTRQLQAQQTPDGIVRETETTSTSVCTHTTQTKAWLEGSDVALQLAKRSPYSSMLGTSSIVTENYSPDEAEHLGKLLIDLAQQARAVQARKPWPGGPLGGTRQG